MLGGRQDSQAGNGAGYENGKLNNPDFGRSASRESFQHGKSNVQCPMPSTTHLLKLRDVSTSQSRMEARGGFIGNVSCW